MGGKKQQRTKGNIQPSKSSRAAEMLNQETSGGFIGFGGLKGAAGNSLGYVPCAGGGVVGNEDFEFQVDSELRMVMRRMTKKDATTRLKAIQDFIELCNVKNPEEVQGVLPFWPKIYNKLALDVDHRAREAAQLAHMEVVTRCGKKLAPFLKLIMPYWLLSQFDPSTSAASVAKGSFATTFSGARQSDALLFCRTEVFENFENNLFHCTSDSLSDPKLIPKEEREAKYHRLLACTLLAINHLIQSCTLEVANKLRDNYRAIIQAKKFWKLSKHTTVLVRSSFYELLSTLLDKELSIVIEMKSALCPVVFDAINESSPAVVKHSWNCILQTIKFVQDCWEFVNINKFVLPKLWSLLKGSGLGNVATAYPCVLPLLSNLPLTVVGNGKDFYTLFFSKFKEGLVVEKPNFSREDKKQIVSSLMDCLKHLLSNPFVNSALYSTGEELEKQEYETVESLTNHVMIHLIRIAILEATIWAQDLFLRTRTLVQHLMELKTSAENISQKRVLYTVELIEMGFESMLQDVLEANGTKSFAFLEEFLRSLSPSGNAMYKNSFSALSYIDSSERSGDCCLTGLSNRLQSSVCRLCCTRIANGEVMPFVVLLANTVAFRPSIQAVKDINHLLSQQLDERQEDDIIVCLTVAGLFAKSFIVEDWLFDESADCLLPKEAARVQRTLIHFLCKLQSLLDDKDSKLEYSAHLFQLSHSRGFLYRIVPELHCILTDDIFTTWLSSSGAGKRVIQNVKNTLLHSRNDEYMTDMWNALRAIATDISSSGLFLGENDIKDISELIIMKLSDASSNAGFAKIGQDLVVFCSDFIKTIQGEYFKIALQLFTALSNFMVMQDEENLMTTCKECQLLLMKQFSSSTSSAAFFKEMQSWIKKMFKIISDIPRMHRLMDFVFECLNHLQHGTDQTKAYDHQTPVDFLFNLMPTGSDWITFCKARILEKELLLIPSINKGLLSLHCLDQQEAINQGEGDMVLALPFFALKTLEKLITFEESRFQLVNRDIFINSFVSAIESFCVYSVVLEQRAAIKEHPQHDSYEAEAAVEIAFEEVQSLLSNLICSPLLPSEQLLKKTLSRSSTDGVIALDYLLDKLESVRLENHDELLFESFGTTNPSDQLSIGFACVALVHVHDMSVIRALLEQYCDELFSTDLNNSHATSGLLRLCLTAIQSWYYQLKKRDGDLTDYVEFMSGFLNHLISWKESHQEWLIFSIDDTMHVCSDILDINLTIARLFGISLATVFMHLSRDHWDFLLCSCASWLQMMESLSRSASDNESFVLFSCSVLNLVSILNELFDRRHGTRLSKLDPIFPTIKNECPWMRGQLDFPPSLQLEESLVTEWEEFFTPSIHRSSFNLFQQLNTDYPKNEVASKQVARHLLSHCLASSLVMFPPLLLSEIVRGETDSDNSSKIRRGKSDYQRSLIENNVNQLLLLLCHPTHPIAVSSYHLLARLAFDIHQNLCQTEEHDEGAVRSLPMVLMDVINKCSKELLVVLSDSGAWIGEPLTSLNAKDSSIFLGYLLSWLLIFRIIKTAPASSRAAYASFLSKQDLLRNFVVAVFSIMPSNVGWNPTLEDTHLQLEYERFTVMDLQQLALLAFHVGLECTPALIRSVWNNALDRKSAGYIERFTSRVISPNICTQEMNLIQASCSKFSNMEVKCRPAAKEVAAIYTIEDITMELVVKLSSCHPLGLITVECGKRIGVSTAQWRQWMLQLTMFLTQQNGSVLDGLTLWKKNVDKKFEGIEECMICFSVIHGSNYSLPSIGCKTCKKKFHAACLYKWFHTSNNSTCPLCRNIF